MVKIDLDKWKYSLKNSGENDSFRNSGFHAFTQEIRHNVQRSVVGNKTLRLYCLYEYFILEKKLSLFVVGMISFTIVTHLPCKSVREYCVTFDMYANDLYEVEEIQRQRTNW